MRDYSKSYRKFNNRSWPKLKLSMTLSVVVLISLILFSLQLMSTATQESSQLSDMYSLLLLINAAGSVVLLILIGANVYSLVKRLIKREAGSRLTTRMVLLFVLLSLMPAGVVFYFSTQFLHQGIDSWFNVEIDRAMEDALELSQASLEQLMRWRLNQTLKMGEDLSVQSEALAVIELETLRKNSNAAEMTLLSMQGGIIASSSINPSDILPGILLDRVWLQLREGKDYIGLDNVRDGKLMIQTVVGIASEPRRYLQVLYPVPVRIGDLADSVEFAFVRYQEMTFLRDSLKLSFSLALLLVLLLSLFAAIWIAFISIRLIVAPVKQLVKGTQAVAAGHYEQQLPVMYQDDLGFLVESFNQMTRRIADARDEARVASFEIESQRAYLETILANLTSGVISLDAGFNIRTANQAVNRILHIQVSRFMGQPLSALANRRSGLTALVAAIQKRVTSAEDAWQQRLAFFGASGRQELLWRGTPLFSSEGYRIGAVVVCDDVTDLIQAQKNAAWGEVARRLAHEIKNPLTPIQLSAERLQHKLSGVLEEKQAEMLERSTRTIVLQVKAMKKMVDEFSEYARPAKKQTETIDMSRLLQEVLSLYASERKVKFNTSFAVDIPKMNVDPVSIRQVLHNLIKNALEAVAFDGEISLELHRIRKHNAEFIEIAVYDDGVGISDAQLDNVFEPYVTTKTKGTGLGLAIVKKIIEEHGGVIWVDNTYRKGAGFIIQLPVN